MIGHRLQGLRFVLTAVNVGVAMVVFWSLYLIVFTLGDLTPVNVSYWPFLLVSTAALLAWSLKRPSTRLSLLSEGVGKEIFGAMRQGLTVAFALSFYLVITKDTTISRTFLLGYLVALTFALMLSGVFVPRMLTAVFFGGRRRCRTVVLGATAGSRDLVAWINSKAMYGLEFSGAIADAPDGLGSKYLGTSERLEEILESSRAHVLMADGSTPREEMHRIKRICDRLGIRLVFPCNLVSGVEEPVSFFEDSGLQFLSFRSEPLESPFNRFLKRSLDLAVAFPVIVTVLPALTIFVWLVQRFQSRGPVFYRQNRVGHQDEIFRMFKFRTMHVGDYDHALQATKGDARVYPIGRFLRRLSLDEIPQFINVMLGDMSIVGPRPHLAEHQIHFATVSHAYRVRNLIKPGITGLAQVRGYRGETKMDSDIVNRTDSDIFYLENWSLQLDLSIISRTAIQMLKAPKSAY